MAPKVKLPDVLRTMDIFEELSNQDLEQVSRLVRERRAPENAVLFRQGDSGDTMYIVKEGRIKIVTADSVGRERVLAFYGEGGFFGEMAVLTGAPRTATAVAATNCSLLALRKEDFDKLLSSNVTIMKHMLKVVALRQADTSRRMMDKSSESGFGGRVYTLFAPRGGSGKTMLAT